MTTYERKIDCGCVEEFIWDKLVLSYTGEFSGIKKLSNEDLTKLMCMCEIELMLTSNLV